MKFARAGWLLLLGSVCQAELVSLEDNELEDVAGQMGLLQVDRFNHEGNNFYRLEFNSTIQTSLNVEKFVLSDADGNPQIDIDNFSLNGGDRGTFNNATQSFSNDVVSSARISNPFLEFAFSGSLDNDDISTREFIGVRAGAEGLDGFLSFGSQQDESGINFFRGFLQTGPITGTASTLDSAGGMLTLAPGQAVPETLMGRSGTNPPFEIQAFTCITLINGINCSGTGNQEIDGITADVTIPDATLAFPSVSLDDGNGGPITLRASGITLNTSDGVAVSRIPIETDVLNLPALPFRLTGQGEAAVSVFGLGLITIDPMVIATGVLGDENTGEQLQAVSTINQELRFIHRTQVTGNGTYLSFQNRPIAWRNAPVGDVAQPGWWLSVRDPVQLGDVEITGLPIPDASLVQVSERATETLRNQLRTPIFAFDALGAVVTTDVGVVPFDNTNITPISLIINESQNLGPNQIEVRNCWNGQLGC